jgi:hypothetical protein
MKKSIKLLGIAGLIIFIVGIAMGMFYFMTATWADVESIYYGFTHYYAEPTTALKCPIFVTDAETGTAKIVVKNTTDGELRPTIWTEASNKGFLVPQTERLLLQSGESQTVTLELAPENEVMGHFVFVKIFMYTTYPMPNTEQTCGIYTLNLTHFTGIEVSIFLIVGSVLLMALGIFLWGKANKPLAGRTLDLLRAMVVLSIVIGVGIFSTFIASWVMGLIATVVTILLIGVLMANLVQKI